MNFKLTAAFYYGIFFSDNIQCVYIKLPQRLEQNENNNLFKYKLMITAEQFIMRVALRNDKEYSV